MESAFVYISKLVKYDVGQIVKNGRVKARLIKNVPGRGQDIFTAF